MDLHSSSLHDWNGYVGVGGGFGGGGGFGVVVNCATQAAGVCLC